MSLMRNGYAVPTRRGFLGVLFSALLTLALFYPGAATAQELKQIKLTEKHIQGFLAAFTDMAKLYHGANPDKPDPNVEAQIEAVAKKNGFTSFAEYDDVSTNISMIMSGIDPQTKKFTAPSEQIKKEIAALKADKTVPEAEKKEDLAQLELLDQALSPLADRGGAEDRKAHSIQGKHRAGAKVLRQARAARAGAGFATCGLEILQFREILEEERNKLPTKQKRGWRRSCWSSEW